MKKLRKKIISLDGPLLDKATIAFSDSVNMSQYPFSLPLIQNLTEIVFPTQVTFFVGENGAGKSTILEALAQKAGFGLEGGGKNIKFTTSQEKTYIGAQDFAQNITLSWRYKTHGGYFFRAESFFNLANHIDQLAQDDQRIYTPYGGRSLHEQSHGESFLSFFKNRLYENELFMFDEPEAALSPQRQLSLMAIIHDLCKNSHAQFIIATHSPILLAYPNATIYSCDGPKLTKITYEETDHYQITKRFLDNPDFYLRHLFYDYSKIE